MDSDNVIHQNTVWLMIDAAPLRLLTGEKKKKNFNFWMNPIFMQISPDQVLE